MLIVTKLVLASGVAVFATASPTHLNPMADSAVAASSSAGSLADTTAAFRAAPPCDGRCDVWQLVVQGR